MDRVKRIVGLVGLAIGIPVAAMAQVQMGVSAGPNGNAFYLAIGSYYQAPQEQVAVCQQRHIPDEEMPVVFFIAKRAHVAPSVVVDLRAGGASWVDILGRYRLNPRIFYVKLNGSVVGTPYAHYYDFYRHRGHVALVDADIVNMVNLRFASEYYHRPAEEVVKLRGQYRDYRALHEHYRPAPHPGPKMRHDRREDRREDRRDKRDDRHDDHRDWKDDHHDDHRP
ncbi:MAG TPA: hypothetical protein VHE12_00255 [bacterium]|nr:hypothetical protein [bacterium]